MLAIKMHRNAQTLFFYYKIAVHVQFVLSIRTLWNGNSNPLQVTHDNIASFI